MKRITFNQVNRWARKVEKPLENEPDLERFQEDYFGDFRHWYYRFFYHMVAEMKPKVALEIGIDHGHTLAHMAAANSGTIVLGVDRRSGCAEHMPHHDNVEAIYSSSLGDYAQVRINRLVEKFGKIGIVFQDSSHHYNDSHKEFEIYSQLLDTNAIWCVDDVMDVFHDPLIDPPNKSMVEYFKELPGRKKIYDNLHYGSVIGVSLL